MMNAVFIGKICIICIHVDYTGVICDTINSICFVSILRIFCNRFLARIPCKHIFIDNLGIIRKSYGRDKVFCKSKAVHFKPEITGCRKINRRNPVTCKRHGLNPPDGLRQFYRLNLIVIKCRRKDCDHSLRQRNGCKIISCKCILCNDEITTFCNDIGYGIIIIHHHSGWEFYRRKTFVLKCTFCDSDDHVPFVVYRRNHQIRIQGKLCFSGF